MTRRRWLAAFVALHGLAHLAGSADLLGRAADGRAAELLGGAWTLGDAASTGALGLAAGLVAFGYAGAAVAMWTGRSGWPAVLRGATRASLVVVLLALPASAVGLVIDLALLAVAARPRLVDGRRAGAPPARPGAPAAGHG